MDAEDLWVKASNIFLELGGPAARMLQEQVQGFGFVTTAAALRRLEREKAWSRQFEQVARELDLLRGAVIESLAKGGVTLNNNNTQELVATVQQQAHTVVRVENHVRQKLPDVVRHLETVGTSDAASLAREGEALVESSDSGTPYLSRVGRFLERVKDFAKLTGDIAIPLTAAVRDIGSLF